jgi:hypothetical protein
MEENQKSGHWDANGNFQIDALKNRPIIIISFRGIKKKESRKLHNSVIQSI